MIGPKLRFKAFSDELSHHTLMDIIVEKPSNGIMNRQSDKVTAVKHINVIDMYADDKIHVDELSYSEYGDTAVEKCNVEIGDIFLTRSSVKADGIAKSNILLDDGIYVYDDHLIRLKVDKNNYIPEFVNDYLASPRFRRQFIVRAKTTAFTTIGQGDVASCTGDFPSLPEQQKIAEFLSTINTVIEKQKETVSAWEERKKGVMQKLFSQEVRFKADDGSEFPEWEEKKLGEVGDIMTGNTPSTKQEDYYGGCYLWVTPTDITDSREVSATAKKLTELGYTVARHIPANSVLVTCIASIGKNAIIRENGSCNQQINSITPYNDYSVEFVYYLICQNERLLHANAGTGGMEILNKDSFSKIKMSFPCLAEQQKIADCLSSLDEVIERQEATLAAWEELKKGLLQQMFV